jgi:hypothetical protein
LRLVICERGRRRSLPTPRPFVSGAATRPSGPVAAASWGATASCACKPPRIGPPASTSTTLATTAKRVGGQVAHDARGGRRRDQLRKWRISGLLPRGVTGPAFVPAGVFTLTGLRGCVSVWGSSLAASTARQCRPWRCRWRSLIALTSAMSWAVIASRSSRSGQ